MKNKINLSLINFVVGSELTRLATERDRITFQNEDASMNDVGSADSIIRINQWQEAISEASNLLNNTETKVQYHRGEVIIGNPNGIFIASRHTCQCSDSENGLPCEHRAIFTLVTKAYEIEQVLNRNY